MVELKHTTKRNKVKNLIKSLTYHINMRNPWIKNKKKKKTKIKTRDKNTPLDT